MIGRTRRRRGCYESNGGGLVSGSAEPMILPPPTIAEEGNHQQVVGRRRGRRSSIAIPSPPYTATTTNTLNNDDNGRGRSVVASRRRTLAARHGVRGGVEFQIPPTPSTTTQQTTIQQTMRSPPTHPLNGPSNNEDNSNINSTEGATNAATHRKKATRYKRVKDCNCPSCLLRISGDEGIKKWEDSEAKAHLRCILEGDKSHQYWHDPPSKVYDDNKALFHLYKYENFSTNLRSLKNGISSEQENLDFDEAAIERESIAFPRGQTTSHGNPFYDTSETKKILVKLAKEGKLEQYKHHPKQLKQSNPIFEEFTNDTVFAKAVNREKRRVKETVGWQMKRNVVGSKKHNARYDKVQEEE